MSSISTFAGCEVVSAKIADIKPYGRNPRKNDNAVEMVAKSIKEFGFRQPIVVDKDGVIIVGHTRYKAAVMLDMTDVPVIYASLTKMQAKQYRIADNKAHEFAIWDEQKLAEELAEITNECGVVEAMGFSEGEINRLLEEDLGIKPTNFVGDEENSCVTCPKCGCSFTVSK